MKTQRLARTRKENCKDTQRKDVRNNNGNEQRTDRASKMDAE